MFTCRGDGLVKEDLFIIMNGGGWIGGKDGTDGVHQTDGWINI